MYKISIALLVCGNGLVSIRPYNVVIFTRQRAKKPGKKS